MNPELFDQEILVEVDEDIVPAGASGPLNLSDAGATGLGWGRLLTRLRILTNGRELWALLDQALVSGVNFLTFALLARALGVREFGVFALAWSVVLLAGNLQGALVVSPMMSVGPKQAAETAPEYFGAVSLQAVLLAVASFLCVYVVALASMRWFPSWGILPLALPLSAATGSYILQDFTRRYLFTRRQVLFALLTDAVSYLPQLAVLWWMGSRHHLSSVRALWVVSATSLVAVGASIGMGWRVRLNLHALRATTRRHWPLVRWLAPSSVLQWLSLNLFVVAAPIQYGAAAAGALRACQNIVGVAHIWYLGLDNVLPGEAARVFHQEGVNALLTYMYRALIRWGLITAAVMSVIGLFPFFWLHLIYGAQYTSFGYVLRLYTVLYLMYFIGVPLRAGLQAIEFTAPMLWSYCAMTLFAAVMAVPLAKHLGLGGVLFGLMLTQLIFQSILAIALWVRAYGMRRQQLLLLGEPQR